MSAAKLLEAYWSATPNFTADTSLLRPGVSTVKQSDLASLPSDYVWWTTIDCCAAP